MRSRWRYDAGVLACFFPGQGSQSPGMGRDLADAHPVARQTFEEADEALGTSLSKTIFEGTEEELKRTEVTQPAILTTSVATWRALTAALPNLGPSFAAGHSLGEWSALVAAGAVTFADAVRLVQLRGRFMQEAVPEGLGAMSAIVGVEPDVVAEVCDEVAAETGEVVAPANINSAEQLVISGAAAAVEAACARLRDAGAKKIIALPVSAPFHCALMQPAAERLADAMSSVRFSAPSIPVVTNVEAQPNLNGERIAGLLTAQVTGSVRWLESVQWTLPASSAVSNAA